MKAKDIFEKLKRNEGKIALRLGIGASIATIIGLIVALLPSPAKRVENLLEEQDKMIEKLSYQPLPDSIEVKYPNVMYLDKVQNGILLYFESLRNLDINIKQGKTEEERRVLVVNCLRTILKSTEYDKPIMDNFLLYLISKGEIENNDGALFLNKLEVLNKQKEALNIELNNVWSQIEHLGQ